MSFFNVYYIPEYLEWARTNFPEHKIILNMVHYPSHFSIKNLPPHTKSTLSQRFKYIDSKKYNLLHPQSIKTLIEFMGIGDDNLELMNAVKEIRRADKYRGEKFEEVFPEMVAALKNQA